MSAIGRNLIVDSFSLPHIPRHRLRQALGQPVRRRVAQQALRLADVGLGVAHVAGAEVAVHGLVPQS